MHILSKTLGFPKRMILPNSETIKHLDPLRHAYLARVLMPAHSQLRQEGTELLGRRPVVLGVLADGAHDEIPRDAVAQRPRRHVWLDGVVALYINGVRANRVTLDTWICLEHVRERDFRLALHAPLERRETPRLRGRETPCDVDESEGRAVLAISICRRKSR